MLNRNNPNHVPVLLKETIEGLAIRKGEAYIDATLGEAGHAQEILNKGGRLLGIDRDGEAVRRVAKRLNAVARIAGKKTAEGTASAIVVQGNFKDLAMIARREGFSGVRGILFDLGVSSRQIEEKSGLSFLKDAPLDMRLDQSESLTARRIINEWEEDRLYEVFTRNAQEELAWPIARAIVLARRLKPIETTGELVRVIEKGVIGRRKRPRLHPATKVFLALRMEVNREIENLETGLKEALEILEPKGRLVVISFQETEDRIVKRLMKKMQEEGKLLILTKKPTTPTDQEIKSNFRSRSAKLRIGERN